MSRSARWTALTRTDPQSMLGQTAFIGAARVSVRGQKRGLFGRCVRECRAGCALGVSGRVDATPSGDCRYANDPTPSGVRYRDTSRGPVVRVIAVALLLLLMPALTGCGPTFGGAPTTGRCRVKFAQPYRPRITAGRLIRGEASAVCTGPVDSHHVALYLELNTGAGWQVRHEDTNDAIPYPKSLVLLVIVECQPGTWRLRYDVTATYQGQSAHANDASDQLAVKTQQDCQVPQ